MGNDYTQIDITKDETVKLFQSLVFPVAVDHDCEGGIVCKNPNCEEYQTGGSGSDTRRILTNDKHVLFGFQCEECNQVSFYVMNVYKFDSDFEVEEE